MALGRRASQACGTNLRIGRRRYTIACTLSPGASTRIFAYDTAGPHGMVDQPHNQTKSTVVSGSQAGCIHVRRR